ncbi:MAG: LysR family transcriptional regulator [Methylibium sp.]|uniref:LysR family transcriptional regulator n=1 Tax=Methylibium sp. TaxID=2067992 RepID=UPI001859ABD9|nr:LysR family transcriptional regulator [Methylibium sp.]MBA3598759.1 LysR family transcriptional regulator [Methylibium sp.]
MNTGLIDLRAWRQFVAVAELLHFGRAAARLSMTQPPLSMAIQQLEGRLGVRLFERSRRSVALTPAGAALLGPVREWLAQGEALAARARAAGGGEVGRLRLGFVSTLGFGPLPGWLRGFRERHPGIEIALREATTDVQREAFAQGELDAGFMLHAGGIAAEVEVQGLMALRVSEEPLVLALPEMHTLAAAPRLGRAALPALLAEPLVIFPRAVAPSLFDAVLACYHRHRAVPVIAQEAIQMQTIVNLVSAGLGIAWVPEAMTQLQRPGVVYRSLPAALAAAAPRCQSSLVWQRDAPAVVERFVGFVRASLRGARAGRAA